jgi:hypothetical protein
MAEIPVESAKSVLGPVTSFIWEFTKWFYGEFLPFVIQYIGLPMFFLGILLAFAFAGGTLLFMIIFFIFMYYFIKGTIFNSNPFPNKLKK